MRGMRSQRPPGSDKREPNERPGIEKPSVWNGGIMLHERRCARSNEVRLYGLIRGECPFGLPSIPIATRSPAKDSNPEPLIKSPAR